MVKGVLLAAAVVNLMHRVNFCHTRNMAPLTAPPSQVLKLINADRPEKLVKELFKYLSGNKKRK